MVFKRMVVKGELSKYLGKTVKEIDIMMLELGLYYVSEQNYLNLGEKERELIDHYSQGINQCAQNR